MSIQALAWVLEHSAAEKSARLVLICLANHADSDGTKAFPKVETIAREARLSERSVQYALRSLEGDGMIASSGSTQRGTTIYAINMGGAKTAGANPAGVQKHANGRAEIAPEPSLFNRPSEAKASDSNNGRASVKFRGKAVNAKAWALAQRVFAEFNRQTQHDQGLLKATGEMSESAKRVYRACRDFPNVTFEEHADIIHRTLESHWWGDGPPTVGVVYGPKCFEENMTRPAHPPPRSINSAPRFMSAAVLKAQLSAEQARRAKPAAERVRQREMCS